jgi:hypothetical protein
MGLPEWSPDHRRFVDCGFAVEPVNCCCEIVKSHHTRESQLVDGGQLRNKSTDLQDWTRETRQGPGTSSGAFRVGNPLEQIVPISGNAPQTCCGLANRSSEWQRISELSEELNRALDEQGFGREEK